MVKYTGIYDHPTDVDAFDRHYLGTHVALAKQLLGYAGWRPPVLLTVPTARCRPTI